MDERERQHLSLLFAHERDLSLRSFDKSLQAIYGECAAKGLFDSGVRIRRAVNLIGEVVENYARLVVAKALDVAPDNECHDLVAENSGVVFSTLEARLPAIVWPPHGNPPLGRSGAFEAAKLLLAEIGSDLSKTLEIARFDFGPSESGNLAAQSTNSTPPTEASEPATERQEARRAVWLNMSQAIAWVRYRTDEAIIRFDSWTALAGEKLYGETTGERPQVGSEADLKEALETGKLTAYATKGGEEIAAIPAVAWSDLPLNPLNPDRSYPYKGIVIAYAALSEAFPALPNRLPPLAC